MSRGPALAAAALGALLLVVWAGLEARAGAWTLAPLGRSLVVAGFAAAAAVGLGLPVAWALAARPRVGLAGGALLLAPLVAPPFLVALAWVDLIGPGGRLVAPVAGRPVGPALLAPSPVYAPWVCGLYLGAAWAPLPAAAALAALRRVDRAGLEAARLAGGRRLELRTLARDVAPAVGAAALAVVALALVERAAPLLAIRGVPVPVQAEEVAQRFAERRLDRTVTAGLPLAGLTLLALAGALALWRAAPARAGPGRGALPVAAASPWWTAGLALIAVAPATLAVALALGWRVLDVGRRDASAPARVVEAVRAALRVGGSDAVRSAWVALLAAALAVGLGLALAWRLRGDRPGRLAAGGLGLGLVVLAAVPPALLGVALLCGLGPPGVERLAGLPMLLPGPRAAALDSPLLVVLALLLRFLPLAAGLLLVAVARLPGAELDAARLAGQAPWRVALPALAPALLGALALVHALAATEFAVTSMVEPPGGSLLGPFVVNEAHYGNGPELAGLLVLLLNVAVVPPLALVGLAQALGPLLRPRLLLGGRA